MPAAKRFSNDDVLDAAEQIFAARGYGETSLRQLIVASKMSPTAFYARYRSKEAVLEALVARVLTAVFQITSGKFGNAASLEAGFEAGADAVVAGISEHKAVMRLLLTEAGSIQSLRDTLQRAYAALANLIGTYLAKQAAKGRARIEEPGSVGWSMIGAGQMHVIRWAVFEEIDDAKLALELRATARLLLQSVQPTPRERAPST
jgi:AcrR family transcriptional regulator